MKSYKYELLVYKKYFSEDFGNVGIKIKRFIGNDKNELIERFEKWFIKQPYDRSDINIHIDQIQHINY